MKTTTMVGMAAAALLFLSCSKNETSDLPTTPNDLAVIGFNTYTGSRAVDNTLVTLEGTSGGFEVIASSKGSGGAQEALFQEVYKYTNGKWGWPSDDAKYKWPTESTAYPLNFVSFFPTVAGLTFAKQDVAVTIAAAIADQKDYISAHSEVVAMPETGKVDLEFKHILSKIQFKILATVGYTVNIQSVTVVNVHDQSTVAAAPTFNPFTSIWTNPITAAAADPIATPYKSYAYRSVATAQAIAGSTTAVAVASDDAGTLMLMPQYGAPIWSSSIFATKAKEIMAGYGATPDWATIKGSWVVDMTAAVWAGSRIEVVYNIQKGADYVVGGANQFIRVGYDLMVNSSTNNWATGKQYTYIIALGGPTTSGGILLDPLYRGADGILTTDPVENPKTTPGDPINSMGVIGFNVAVDPWTNTDIPIQ